MGFFRDVKAHIVKSSSDSNPPSSVRIPNPSTKLKAPSARKAVAKLSSRKDFLFVEAGQSFHQGRYVVEKKLGAGSYSEVWLASDERSVN